MKRGILAGLSPRRVQSSLHHVSALAPRAFSHPKRFALQSSSDHPDGGLHVSWNMLASANLAAQKSCSISRHSQAASAPSDRAR